jgi:hypothetical protein
MRFRLITGLAVAAALPAAPAMAAPVVDSVQVGVPKTVTRTVAPQLGVFLKSPGDFRNTPSWGEKVRVTVFGTPTWTLSTTGAAAAGAAGRAAATARPVIRRKRIGPF